MVLFIMFYKVVFIMLYKVVLTCRFVVERLSGIIQIKATERF